MSQVWLGGEGGGTANTDLHTALYIVGPVPGQGNNFVTVASAITAAAASGVASTVFLQPGTYTENLTLPANVNLVAFVGDDTTPNVTINGTVTCSDAGIRSIAGINLQTNSNFSVIVSGSAATILTIVDSNLNALNNTAISYTSSSSNSQLKILYCTGNLATTGIAMFSGTSAGRLAMFYNRFTNTGLSTTASTMSAGILDTHYDEFDFPITSSGTNTWGSSYVEYNCEVLNTTAVTFGGSNTSSSAFDYFAGGSAPAFSVNALLEIDNASVQSTNTNAITGSSQINWGTITFIGTSSTINTTTQVPLVFSNNAIKVVTPAAYPYTTVPQDAFIKVDTTLARTIIPLANPATGQRHVIKDTTGMAAVHNITVTPSGKNIDGAASYTINSNYGSIMIVYNGTEWSVT